MSFHWKRKELLKYLQLLFSSNKQRLESKEELNKNAWRPVVRWGGEVAVRDGEEVVGALSIRCGVVQWFDSCSNATGVADVSNKCYRKVTPHQLSPDRG